jgi:hypothetical protein
LGETESQAIDNINEVVRMVVESMLEHGERIPEEAPDQVKVTVEPHVAVIVSLVPIDYGQLGTPSVESAQAEQTALSPRGTCFAYLDIGERWRCSLALRA